MANFINLVTNVVQIIPIVIISAAGFKIGAESANIYTVLVMLITLIIIIILFKFKWPHRLYNFLKANKENVVVIFLAGFAFVLALLIFVFGKTMDAGVSTQFMLLVISVTVVILILITERHRVEERNKLKYYNEYLPVIENIVDLLREEKHNYTNRLQTLYGLPYVCKDYDSLVESIQENSIIKNDENRFSLTEISNKFLGSIVYSKYISAKKLGINLDIDVNDREYKSKVSDKEIVDIVGIIIDNAIEASKKGDNIYITIGDWDEDERFSIAVMNPGEKLNDEKIAMMLSKNATSKEENAEEHGLGLYIVKKLVKKNDGILEITNVEAEDQNFINVEVVI
ncbi:MAG: GHKL domain-containing protein [Lachnospiraceae bacterium]|nr:GHKL domain-containing protein [Lachnospiraceae bacterium]